MQLFIRSPASAETIAVEVDSNTTIETLKDMMMDDRNVGSNLSLI